MPELSKKDWKILEKKIKEELKMPEIKGNYDIEKIKKEAHLTPTCPKTGKPYKIIEEGHATGSLGPLSGAIGYRQYCSECGQTTGYRNVIIS